MRFFFPDVEEMPVPPGHRFPAVKYRLLRETIEREAILPIEVSYAIALGDR